MVIYKTFKDIIAHTDAKYPYIYGEKYALPLIIPNIQSIDYQLPTERRQFGEFGIEIKRLETKIERLEKALASKSIPKNISTSSLEKLTKTAIDKELNETLYEPLSKGIAFATGITSIVSLLLVSIIMFFPLALLSGMFWWIYYKFRQKRIHPYSYMSENISEKSNTIWKNYQLIQQFGRI